MQRVKVDSSMLSAVGYDDETQELEIVFNSNRVYRYKGVPKSLFEGLLAAESKGSYMHTRILGAFPEYPVARR